MTLYQAFGRIAAASMRFAEGKPDHWELAVLPGQDTATLKDGEIFGYPVDAGLGCYMDADTLDLIGEREQQAQAQKPDADVNYYDDVLASDLEANKGAYALHRPIAGKKGNVAVFWSGWGDGFYPVFWGLDKDGHALVLLTDFSVVENADGRKRAEAAMSGDGCMARSGKAWLRSRPPRFPVPGVGPRCRVQAGQAVYVDRDGAYELRFAPLTSQACRQATSSRSAR